MSGVISDIKQDIDEHPDTSETFGQGGPLQQEKLVEPHPLSLFQHNSSSPSKIGFDLLSGEIKKQASVQEIVPNLHPLNNGSPLLRA
mmetsp:Transcript_23503/g.17973  ORF Transcript_23503/g.17973 Transcript_23503/m.17973 type:complete len:87 (+) Transcript_23503:1959-2219(+)